MPLREVWDGLVGCGYAKVEFCLEHPEAESASGSPRSLVRMVREASSAGLDPCSTSYHGKRDDPERRARMLGAAVRLAGSAGVPVVVVGSPTASRGDPGAMTALARELDGLLSFGAPAAIALEPEPGTVVSNLEDFRSLNGLLDGRLSLNLDIGHAFLSEADFAAALASALPSTSHMHVEDIRSGIHRHLVPGFGDIPWGTARRILAGYRGPMVVDIFDLPESPWRLVRNARLGAQQELEAL
jgi:sugar phosphate isomerase/epimerase